ncbi:baseplate wedge protein 53 [bacterium]|jgi:hypothetical protein|nr:baseplate wedge protein 53 [bacterium]MDB4435762.1 baseplate wedge protein 53 [bacterium]
MSKYFSYFPTTPHDITNENRTVKLTNILRRFKVDSSLKDRALVFYDYQIQEGDRPDTIAEKYYGSANYSWLVMHFNDMNDVLRDFPLFGDNFENFVAGKYGSVATAQSTIHEYRIFCRHRDANGVDTPAKKRTLIDGTIIEERVLVVDLTTFNATDSAYKYNVAGVTKYDYEVELNEKRRDIELLDVKYLPTVRDEVENVLRNGI